MSTVTTYEFIQGFYNGFYVGQQSADDASLQVGLNLFGPNDVVVKARRPSNEIVVDIGPMLNTPSMLSKVDKLLAGHPEVTRTSGMRVQGVLYKDVPYFLGRPLAHPAMSMLLRTWFKLHVSTPWPMSDADAEVSFYIFARLQGGKIKASVDGAWVHVDGGWPDGQKIADTIGAAAKGAIPMVQDVLNTALGPVVNATFSNMYILPNQGSKAAIVNGNASLDSSVALVP